MIDIGHVLRVATGPAGRHRSHRVALSLEDKESWTWAQLAERVNRLANGLLDLGVAKGDRVGILLYNALDYAALYLAITRVGAIAVRLNWRLAPAARRARCGRTRTPLPSPRCRRCSGSTVRTPSR